MGKKDRGASLSRREFIKTGSTVAAGAVSLAALGAPAVLRGQNLNSKINIGVIGTGSRGCYLIRLMAEHPGITVTDVCDIYPPHLEKGVEDSKNDKVRTHEQWEKLIDQRDVDAVVVSPPLFLHVPCSVAALQAGKHVLSEKSMALDMKQLKEVTATVENTGKVYLVGYQSRMAESYADAKRLVQGGVLGKTIQFYVHYDRNQTWRKDVPPELERVLNWRMYREYCGGILTELLTHQIDMLLDILGTMPVKASCEGRIMVYDDGREHHDSLMGHMVMDDDVIGVVSGTFCNSRWGNCWAIHGTHGTLEFMGNAFRVFFEKETRHLSAVGIKHKFTKIKLGQSLDVSDSPVTVPDKLVDYTGSTTRNSSAKMVDHFYNCIVEGEKPVMDAASASRPSIAAFMLYHSSHDGGRQYTREEIEAMG
ncbi:MAG: Gfo/Idh/MocA family oxidoreductase [Gemmatimonadota bacterium]|nr:Gfo/Idh/MocA family oxidoreductase [Gemmatimonadota bacterium]